MIPTPDLTHLRAADYDLVYEPAEDTFLLLDALESDASILQELTPRICLEIGSGSGCVSAFIGKVLGLSALYLCTDISPHACTCTSRTGTQNQVALNPIRTSFAKPLMQRLRHAVDLLIFNPPYVPTYTEEAEDAQQSRGIQGSWAGGRSGMEVTNQFLQDVENLLSPRGRFYLVAVKENDIAQIQAKMLHHYQLHSKVILQRRAGREHLYILSFFRAHTIES